MKFIEKIKNFLEFRYGTDQLSRFLMILSIILLLLNMFLQALPLYIFCVILIFINSYRMFSKKIELRRRENAVYLLLAGKIKLKYIVLKTRFREREKFAFKKCPFCKATLRLPKKKGRHNVRCPRCAHYFDVDI